MHTTNPLFKRCQIWCLFVISLLSIPTQTNAQGKLRKWLKDRTNELSDATAMVATATGAVLWTKELIYSAQAFKKVNGMSSKEFDKNVTVVKTKSGEDGQAAPVPKKTNKPVYKNGNFTNFNWDPFVYFNNELFPSAIISMASYKGTSPDGRFEALRRPLGFYVISDKSNIPMKWEIECADKRFFDKAFGNILYSEAGKMYYFNADNVPWNYKALVNNYTSNPVSFTFRIFDEDGNKVEKVIPLTMRSINDCLYGYKDVDLKFMFAAYVQEDHINPIDTILRAALNTKMVNDFSGYQSGSIHVDEQVSAIWRVLHEKGFAYSSITKSSMDLSDERDSIHSQWVRTFNNALTTSQANCVDGTVVFASILRKIGIDPVMVTVIEKDLSGQIIGGHCFLGYSVESGAEISKNPEKFHFLETTMLSNTSIYNAVKKKNEDVLLSAKTPEQKKSAYIKLFTLARKVGDLTFDNKMPNETVVITNVIEVSRYRALIGSIPVYNEM